MTGVAIASRRRDAGSFPTQMQRAEASKKTLLATAFDAARNRPAQVEYILTGPTVEIDY